MRIVTLYKSPGNKCRFEQFLRDVTIPGGKNFTNSKFSPLKARHNIDLLSKGHLRKPKRSRDPCSPKKGVPD